MTHKEALKLALECAERCENIDGMYSWADTIAAIKEALAQPEQKPVAHLWQHCETGRTRIVMPDQIITADANWNVVGHLFLHTTTPHRTWVGLTNSEKYALSNDVSQRGVPVFEAICEAEAKLKEKNV